MKLKLKRPLVVLDIESTGVNFVTDRIIELFLLKIKPDGTECNYLQRFNPGIPIPKESTQVHGITNEEVANMPTFEEKAKEILQYLGDADLAGFNSNKFDVPMLMEEMGRAGLDLEVEKRKLIDAQRIFHQKEPRNLEAAYRFYCQKDLENAHTAEADTRATWDIIKAQIEKYTDLDATVDQLHRFCNHQESADLAGRIVLDANQTYLFNFGKHKGKPIKQVFKAEPAYFDWIMKSDFSTQTKKIFTRIRLEMMNDK
jgi:DNA polymerase-3 subunit epsilon